MTCDNVTTIMLTTKCIAGCCHCPFSDQKLEALYLAEETIQQIFSSSTAELIVLSGGEPFEHPQIGSILMNLKSVKKPIRIASGGFVDLTPWIQIIQSLLQPFGTLQGVSMGTDVLSSRVMHAEWISIWKNNRPLSKLRFYRFLGSFEPIFDSNYKGHIRVDITLVI